MTIRHPDVDFGMKMPRLTVLPQLAAIALLIPACQSSSPADSETHPAGTNVLSAAEQERALKGTVDFSHHVKPILETRCVMCHNQDALPGRMNLTNRATAVRTGALGSFIIPGHPEQSHFVTRIGSSPGHLKSMPPVGQRITKDDVAVLQRWIAQGAPWPAGSAGALRAGPF